MAKLFPESESSARYLALLSDTKATYNPGANIPGYYRYYSSSHPDPEMQGPASWEVSETGVVSVGTQTKVDASKSQTSTQFKSTTSGGTTFVTGAEVKAGIPILKPGTTDQTVSTPTHQITTFQIARYPINQEGTKSVETGQLPSGFPTTALATAYREYFLPKMQNVPVGPTSTVGDSFTSTFDLVANLIREKVGVKPELPHSSETVSSLRGFDTPSKLTFLAQDMADACATTVSNALVSEYRIVQPVTGVVTSSFGTRSPPKTNQGEGSTQHRGTDFAGAIGDPIYAALGGTVVFAGPRGGYGNLLIIQHVEGTTTRYAHCDTILVAVGDVVTAGQEVATVGATGNVSGPHLHFEVRTATGVAVNPELFLSGATVADIDAIWSSVWPQGAQVKAGVGRRPRQKAQTQVKYYDVPVLPVSDARGYEVVGTYRYGRGLTLESLESASGFVSSSTDDYESIEAFLDAIEADVSEAALGVAIGNLSPSLRAQLASRTMSETVTNIVLSLDNPGGSQTDIGGMNFPVDKREFTQKSTLTNAAYGLADMVAASGSRSVCACKGAEADTLLQAFDTELFVGLEDVGTGETEMVQDWLTEQMTSSSMDWSATQAAYRGTVRDMNTTGLVSAVRDAVNTIAGNFNQTGEQLSSIGATAGAQITAAFEGDD
jgi:murein DD-endopeptidase MepM/ murein hydrolase activator NlpD